MRGRRSARWRLRCGRLAGVGTQPGYDALAEQYELAFPDPFQTPLERHAVAAFTDMVLQHHGEGAVVDIGCGTGHVTADLAHRGLHVVGIDPSEAMLDIARRSHPEVVFRRGEANLNDSLESTDQRVPLRGVLVRFSLIHVEPHHIGGVLASWAPRMPVGGVVLLAFQSIDDERQTGGAVRSRGGTSLALAPRRDEPATFLGWIRRGLAHGEPA